MSSVTHPPQPPAPADWRDHVVVCGLRGLAGRAVEQLRSAGSAVVVLDDRADPGLAALLPGLGVPLLALDARAPGALDAAGLAGASAVVCTDGDDVARLETALLVHERAPGTRVVVQLDNPAVGAALREVTGPASVLDAAGLAAPSLVEACTPRAQHVVELDGERFVVATREVSSTGTVRSAFGDAAPVAVIPAAGPLVVCPGRDHPLVAGDGVVLVEPAPPEVPARRTAVGARFAGVRDPGPGARRRRRGPVRVAREFVADLDRPLKAAVVAFFVSMLVSTVVTWLGYRRPDGSGISLLDALYFSASTDATVGYGDFAFGGQAPWLVAFGIADIVTGVAIATTLFAFITNLLVTRRLDQALGRQRMAGLSGHVVVVGLGTVGTRVVARLLERGDDVVAVERSEQGRNLAAVRDGGARVVIGDASAAGVLEHAQVAGARAVMVLTSDDLTNIEVALAVRETLGERWAGTPVVLRVRDRQLARSVSASFGFRHVRSTTGLVAPHVVGAALGLDVVDTFVVADQTFVVGRLTVTAGGGLDGATLVELPGRTRVLAVRSPGGPLRHPPRRDTRLTAGDDVHVVGTHDELIGLLGQDLSGADRPGAAARTAGGPS